MKQLLLTALLSSTMLLPAVAQEEHSNWVADFDVAAAQAQKEGKDLFVDFTGSDWCGWCIKLHEEVFDHAAFKDFAEKHYVLVALDFPKAEAIKAKVPNPERNDELKNKYGIRGFPTILLMTPEGEVFGKTGYKAGGPDAYVTHLQEIASKGKAGLIAAEKLSLQFEAAKTKKERIATIGEALHSMAGMGADSPGIGTLAGLARKGYELGDDTFRLECLKAVIGVGVGNDDDFGMAWELDPKNADGLLDHVTMASFGNVRSLDGVKAAVAALEKLESVGGFKDKELGLPAYMNVAYWHSKALKDAEGAKLWAQKALDLGVEIEPRAKEMLEGILSE